MARPFTFQLERPMFAMEFLTQEQAIIVYDVTVPEGTDPAELLKPTAWANYVHRLRPNYGLVVRPADGAWRLHLEVRSVSKTSALVAQLSFVEFDTADDLPEENIYIAKYRGPAHMHCVVRKDTGAIEKTGFQTAEDAKAWIAAQTKALAA